MSTSTTARQYQVRAASSGVFGRVLCSARHQHFVVDGPVQNGCPGEAMTPPEAFLAGVASCGVELIEVFARQDGIPLERVEAEITGTIDRGNPVRTDVTVFNEVALDLRLHGVTAEQAAHLVTRFQKS
ncbi:MAG TPA: OsmC family protein [Kofleriaceae bacterium]|nr:OsmC family protein [Kofleriaceae bacterium]